MADEPPDNRTEHGQWHLTLLSVLLGCFLAIGGWVWWFGNEARAVTEVTRRVTDLEQRRDTVDERMNDIINRLARIEGNVQIMLLRTDGKK